MWSGEVQTCRSGDVYMFSLPVVVSKLWVGNIPPSLDEHLSVFVVD